MDLWIRSQDREVLTKVIDIYKQADTNEIWSYSDRCIKNCLGVYKTKERALEIMEQINERITLLNTMALVNDRDSLIAFKRALGEDKLQGLGVPFQMPLE